MNNFELYKNLKREVDTTGTVYFRDVIGTYTRAQEVYAPASVQAFHFEPQSDELKMDIVLPATSITKYNVLPRDLYLPAPMSSRFHGDMVPVRTYFEMQEAAPGSNDIHFNYRYIPETRQIPKKEFKEMLGKQSIEQLSFGFYKKDTKFDYDKIIFSGPCTIVLWGDGTKTMARVSEDDEFDPEKGVAVCFMKKIMGHTETNKLLRKAHEQYQDEQDQIDLIKII